MPAALVTTGNEVSGLGPAPTLTNCQRIAADNALAHKKGDRYGNSSGADGCNQGAPAPRRGAGDGGLKGARVSQDRLPGLTSRPRPLTPPSGPTPWRRF